MKIDPRTTLRLALALVVLTFATFVAAGCDGSDGDGSSSSSLAKDGRGVEYVPKDALVSAVIDLDEESDAWKNAKDLAQRFPSYGKVLEDIRNDAFSDDISWNDVKKVTGDQAGVAVLSLKNPDDVLLWGTPEDDDDAESVLKKDFTGDTTSEHDGWTIHTGTTKDGDELSWAVNDGVALASVEKTAVEDAIDAKDGSNITDAPGFDDAVDDLKSDTPLVTIYANYRQLLENAADFAEDNPLASFQSLTGQAAIKAVEGVAVAVSAEDDGFRIEGNEQLDADQIDEDQLGESFEPSLLEDMPDDSVAALTIGSLGSSLERGLEQLDETSPELASQISALETLSGITVDDIAEAWDGQAVVAVREGGLPLPPVGIVLEATDEGKASDAGKKMLAGIAKRTGGSAPKNVDIDGIEAQQATFSGISVYVATFDGKTVITTSRDFMTAIQDGGGDSLGSSDAFSEARKSADAPDKVAAEFFVDTQQVIDMLGSYGQNLQTEDTEHIGPLFGWIATEGEDSVSFALFAEITE